ncbi:hypothetical protein [Aquimarina sp. AU474]|uniref:hypothetical protein n=1 Tax=Aquimarina sp. AU474 TaxID=2108529 RepID=UPI001356EF3A|nr:hypothetical protein [Aquimarina sp. AU474]
MKKKLEAELISIAHRILKLKDTSTLPQLKEEARQLYEKLTILSFAESHFTEPQPTIGQVEQALEEKEESKESDELREVKQKIAKILEPKSSEDEIIETKVSIETETIQKEDTDTTSVDHKPELVIEEINARVSEDLFVPASTTVEESTSFPESLLPESNYEKNDMDDITPVMDKVILDEKPKSLNEQLRKDINIGLNDRLAFIKYLFDGSAPDYNRVLSQLSTISTRNEAEEFITSMIKPDYGNWEGKEEYEERFMNIVLGKYES